MHFTLLLVEHQHFGVGEHGRVGDAFQGLEEDADVVGDDAQVQSVAAELAATYPSCSIAPGGGLSTIVPGERRVYRLLALGRWRSMLRPCCRSTTGRPPMLTARPRSRS